MKVKNLSDVTVETLIDCFLKAFEGYYVQIPTDLNYYKERWKAAGVDYNSSYGMFIKGKLVGVIIHAVDRRNGSFIAYNTGTGVLPDFRGRGIVKSIYQHALKDLKEKGIEKSILEVITKNELAIRSYKSVGFEICKKYACYQGTFKTKKGKHYELKELELDRVAWKKLPNQQFYSWDNQKETILKGNYKYFQVLSQGEPESFFVINPNTYYLAQFDLLNAQNRGWQRLFSAIHGISNTIKINNVDERLRDKIKILNETGLRKTVEQYEMELTLN